MRAAIGSAVATRPTDRGSSPRLLVVDDEPAVIDSVTRLLRVEGCTDVRGVTDSREALAVFREVSPDLVLLDLHMPHLDGFEVLTLLREATPPGAFVPILILTGNDASSIERQALESGAHDFVTKPIDAERLTTRIRNLLEVRRLYQELERERSSLERRVSERTRELRVAQRETLLLLAKAAEYRDDATGRHAHRVGVLSALVAEALNLDSERVELLRLAAPLHDIGKIAIPDAVLLKPGPLTTVEIEVMRRHAALGGELLSGSSCALLDAAAQIASAHHERWDGSGYPRGLRGSEIPLFARIVAVVDAFDAIVHMRVYSPGCTIEEAVNELSDGRGSQFDPTVVDALIDILDSTRVRALLEGVSDQARGGGATD